MVSLTPERIVGLLNEDQSYKAIPVFCRVDVTFTLYHDKHRDKHRNLCLVSQKLTNFGGVKQFIIEQNKHLYNI